MTVLPALRPEHPPNPRLSAGFTIVELSVVLVIIGLVIGGVLMGKYMIEDAELKAIARQYEMVNVGVTTFKLKYNGLPGDMANATDIWGLWSAGGETRNGDGDGTFDGGCDVEEKLGFEHLTLAGLYPGEIDMDLVGHPNAATIGISYPQSKWRADLGMYLVTPTWWGSHWSKLSRKHYVVTGAEAGNCLDDGYQTSSYDSWRYDMKFDDGLPVSGSIVVFGINDCLVWGDPGEYNPESRELPACDFLYEMKGI